MRVLKLTIDDILIILEWYPFVSNPIDIDGIVYYRLCGHKHESIEIMESDCMVIIRWFYNTIPGLLSDDDNRVFNMVNSFLAEA